MSLRTFNSEVRRSHAATAAHEEPLRAAWARGLRQLGRTAAENFAAATRIGVVAAGLPEDGAHWTPPLLDEIFTTDDAEQMLVGVTKGARGRMVQAATGEWEDKLDPTVRNRITGQVERLLGSRITGTVDSVRDQAGVVIRDAVDKGWSVDRTADALRSQFADFAGSRAMLIARTEMIGAANAGSLGVARELDAAPYKQWLATEDERTRETHADADGQQVPLDEPFQVGGFELMYPGDEGAPPEEVCNCRCTVIYVDDPTGASASSGSDSLSSDDEGDGGDSVMASITATDASEPEEPRTLADAEPPTSVTLPGVLQFVTSATDTVEAPTQFRSLLAPFGTPTADGRILDPAEDGAITWRDLPLPLMWQNELASGGHDGAVIAGRIDSITIGPATVGDWSGTALLATGVFDDGPDGSEAGREAARLARDKTLRGVSIDLAPEEVEMRTSANEPIEADDEEAWLRAMFGDGLMAVTRGKVMGATIVAHPAFSEASVTIVASLAHAELLLAAASAPAPPTEPAEAAWFFTGTSELREAPGVAAPPVSLTAAQGIVVLTAGGIATLNEARAWLGLGRLVGGDVLRAAPAPPVTVEAASEPVDTPTIAASLAMIAAAVDRPVPVPEPAPLPKPRTLRVVRDPASGQALRYEEIEAP